MKVLAMYLPQFHRVKENDEWWGEGFTEWVAAKAAKPLFEGHIQPHIPYKNNYYDLMDKDTMVWQASLMKKYGIDGMVFYHYYFKDGRQILEKPAENLVNWKDIDMPFCFSWVNESWVRSWSNIQGASSWSQVFDEKNSKEEGPEILLEQDYGTRKDWENHFYYFLKFFKDKRYIKIDKKPVLIIYRPHRISCLLEMIECWDKMAIENDLQGIYYIGTDGEGIRADNRMSAMMYQEPTETITHFDGRFENNDIRMQYDYDKVWEHLLEKDVHSGVVYLGGFVSYDDTPRRGRNGMIITGATPYKFERYMRKLFKKAESINSDIVFINAWNEWGEGMYLEPDEENQFAYLQALYKAKMEYGQDESEYFSMEDKYRILQEENKNLKSKTERYKGYWILLDSWLTKKEQKENVISKLISHGHIRIAIYGLGMLGRHLVYEINEFNKNRETEKIDIVYGIDQSGKKGDYDFPIYTLEEDLESVDIIVVTVLYDFEQIKNVLKSKGNYKVISLDEILLDRLL